MSAPEGKPTQVHQKAAAALRKAALAYPETREDTPWGHPAFDVAEPTGYGLGKSGWVTSRFLPGTNVPVELALEWMEESYLAIASAKLRKEVLAKISAKPAKKKK